jgi:glycosyltransferase involved in cell wall biosynthesis
MEHKNKNKNKNNNKNKSMPLVSICTPTFNRRPFIRYMIECFNHQTYPKNRIEWIIIDDGTDPIEDLVKHIPQVKYFYYQEKMMLGQKRNIMHSKCSGDIIVYMDDDDYYPPERISHAVETLQQNPTFLIAGCSEMHIYFNTENKMYAFGPYAPFHSTAATFAFKKELLNSTIYDNATALAEEKHFLKNYTIPLKQLDPLKTILVFSHQHNSLNKEKLLTNKTFSKCSDSLYTVDHFITNPILKQFYMIDMNALLQSYEPGRLENKPKIVEQLAKMEEMRNAKIADHAKKINLINNTIIPCPPDNDVASYIKTLKNNYETQLSDKTYLINELLKKIKTLTTELSKYNN